MADDVDNRSILNAAGGSCSRCTFTEPGGVREKSAGERKTPENVESQRATKPLFRTKIARFSQVVETP